MKSSPEVLALTDPQGSHVVFAYSIQGSLPLGYLKAYDPEAHDGRGEVAFGPKDQALRFDKGKAFECWTMVPESRPVRSDGRPNKPLTAFTISIVPYEEGENLNPTMRLLMKNIHEAKLASTPKD